MKYYDTKKIMEITGYGKTSSWNIIKKFNEMLAKEYPSVEIFNGKIPIWFWEEKMEPNKNKNEKEEK